MKAINEVRKIVKQRFQDAADLRLCFDNYLCPDCAGKMFLVKYTAWIPGFGDEIWQCVNGHEHRRPYMGNCDF